ncbi:hypothetical protein IWX90DRAFT_197585 [Phyllosticta citrichinensis]|uniref:C2H2-type domain-containing protein n=1 Tax=Phyllosticta citrichinensis TaxID=1130410 RepID=A0ABR1XXU1_9PEZI
MSAVEINCSCLKCSRCSRSFWCKKHRYEHHTSLHTATTTRTTTTERHTTQNTKHGNVIQLQHTQLLSLPLPVLFRLFEHDEHDHPPRGHWRRTTCRRLAYDAHAGLLDQRPECLPPTTTSHSCQVRHFRQVRPFRHAIRHDGSASALRHHPRAGLVHVEAFARGRTRRPNGVVRSHSHIFSVFEEG